MEEHLSVSNNTIVDNMLNYLLNHIMQDPTNQ